MGSLRTVLEKVADMADKKEPCIIGSPSWVESKLNFASLFRLAHLGEIDVLISYNESISLIDLTRYLYHLENQGFVVRVDVDDNTIFVSWETSMTDGLMATICRKKAEEVQEKLVDYFMAQIPPVDDSDLHCLALKGQTRLEITLKSCHQHPIPKRVFDTMTSLYYGKFRKEGLYCCWRGNTFVISWEKQ